MGVLDKVSREDRENARLDRDSEVNPPAVEPGMESDGWGSSDGWADGGGDSWGSSGGGGDDGWGAVGGDSWASSGNSWDNMGGGNVDTTPARDVESEMFDKAVDVLKGFKNFVGELIKSFKSFDVLKRLKFSKAVMTTCIIVAVASIIMMILGVSWCFSVMIACLINLSWSVVLFMFSYDKKNELGLVENTEEDVIDFNNMDDEQDDSWGNEGSDGWGDEGSDGWGDDTAESEEDEEEAQGSWLTGGSDTPGLSYANAVISDNPFGMSKDDGLDPDEVLSKIEAQNGMMTKQYVYDCFSAVLPHIDKHYNEPRIIPEGSDEFDAWEAIIRKSADLFRTSQEDSPYLKEAKEKPLYIMLVVKRVKWIKNLEQFIKELVNIYAYDRDTGKLNRSVYGVGDSIGDEWIIRIMKGTPAMVSLKDVLALKKDVMLDSKYHMPVFMGIDAEGEVIWEDFKNVNAMLVTGMPRSGKSWLVKLMLFQMMMLSPRQLQVVFMDPKGRGSDYHSMYTPHVRKFVEKDEDILRELKHIVRVEGARRKQLIGDSLNIWNYRKENPDVDMPLLYVVIDEVVTLSERMDKDTKKEFQGLLTELVTQLPAYGIRILMVPHFIKDQIISKTTTDAIPCRISVMGDADHIEHSCGVKNFKHKLLNIGDAAIRLGNKETEFMHGLILAQSEEKYKELFTYLTKFWVKVEPGCEVGSRYEEFLQREQVKELEKSTYTDTQTKTTGVSATRQETSANTNIATPVPTQTADEETPEERRARMRARRASRISVMDEKPKAEPQSQSTGWGTQTEVTETPQSTGWGADDTSSTGWGNSASDDTQSEPTGWGTDTTVSQEDSTDDTDEENVWGSSTEENNGFEVWE